MISAFLAAHSYRKAMLQLNKTLHKKNEMNVIHVPTLFINPISLTYFDRSLQLGLLVTEPHHSNNGHGNAEPIEEAEEVYDGENVIGEGVQQRHQTLEREEPEREAVRSLALSKN